jgi:hypothetical protein
VNKIPTIFLRDLNDMRHITREPNPVCAWVFAGEGVATQKYDGTCIRRTKDGMWWARREVKPGKAAPPNYVPVELDETTGKMVGWEPIEASAFAKYHAQALRDTETVISQSGWPAGTYELVGPKINGNPERLEDHNLWAHAAATVLEPVPRDYDGLAKLLATFDGEGIVFHHPDGRMAKIKRRDFPA